MPRVLFLTGQLDTADWLRIESLSARLVRRGFAPEVFCLAAPAGCSRPEGLIEVPGLGSRWRRDWTARHLRFADSSRPDVIHVQGVQMAEAGLALAQTAGIPYLLEIDEFLPPGATLRLASRLCRGVLAHGIDLARDLRRNLRIPGDWIEALTPPVELPESDCPDCPSPEDRASVVGLVAKNGLDPGVLTFFEAARWLVKQGEEMEILVSSRVSDEAALRRLVARAGLSERVTFADHRTVGASYWTIFNVYCQSSVVPAAGGTIGQAMAHAVPVVVSNVPGLRSWVIPDQTGLVVPPGDSDALALAILSLLSDPIHAKALGDRARQWIACSACPETYADELAHAYHRALELAPSALRTE